jgi:hypothetical protein
MTLPVPFSGKGGILPDGVSTAPLVEANNTYYNFSGGNLTLNVTPLTTNLITANDDWSGMPSVEGYKGTGLTNTHGVDPQTVLGTEFASNSLPVAGSTHVNANKSNPNSYNAGGVTEFDTGTFLAIGFQGNVQANPYIVFYLNTTGRSNVTISYTVMDIDGGSNSSVSPIALQYRVGETGLFTNVQSAFIADATSGPNAAGATTIINAVLPTAVDNKSKVQVRLITTDAAAPDGSSTPDEWIGINAVVINASSPTSASVSVGGQVIAPSGSGLAKATVTMFDASGNVRTAITNPFGFYRFEDVSAGETYIFEISSKVYAFPNPIRTIFVTEDIDSLNFSAEPLAVEPSKNGALTRKSSISPRKF